MNALIGVVVVALAVMVAQAIGFIGAYRQLRDDLRFERQLRREWTDRAYEIAKKYDALREGQRGL